MRYVTFHLFQSYKSLADSEREMQRKRAPSGGSEHGSDASDHFVSINERPVDDISLEFFYKPHTITTMFVLAAVVTYTAFTR